MVKEYLSVWDIAKNRDFTVGMTFKVSPEIINGAPLANRPDRINTYLDIVAIEKFNDVSYDMIAETIRARVGHELLANNSELLIDGTGVGSAVVDLLRAMNLAPIPIIFTASGQVREVHAEFGKMFDSAPGSFRPLQVVKELHVPKVDLVGAGRLILEQGRLRVAKGLRWAGDLEKQLMAFKGKVNEKTQRTSFGDEGDAHDDMVVCLLMAAWWALRGGNEIKDRPVYRSDKVNEDGWNPADHW